jgi:uncharacterized delta-60 repeat protein
MCILALFLLLSSLCFAQPPDTLWTRMLGDANGGSQEAWGVSPSLDGSVWVAGLRQPGGELASALVYHLDLLGAVQDTFRLTDNTATMYYNAVDATADGGCIAAGRSFAASNSILLMTKLNASGHADWTQTFPDDPTRVCYAVQQTADGGYVAAGRSRDSGQLMRAFLIKTTSTGALQWAHTYGVAFNDQAFDVQQTSDGGFVLTGATDSSGQNANTVLVIRTNAAGVQTWRQSFSPGDWDEGHAIRQTPDGGFVVAGWTRVTGTYNNDMLLIKLSATGTLEWSHHYGSGSVDICEGMEFTQDGGFILCGYSRAGSQANSVLLKTTSAGDSMWTRVFPSSRDAEFRSVAVSADGGITAAGYQYANGNTSYFWVARIAVPSGVRGTILDEQQRPVVGAYIGALGQPYWSRSGTGGRYTLSLLPGTYDLITYGPCTGRDTVRGITVLEDSLAAHDWVVGSTGGVVDQTSLNPVVHNHMASADSLYLHNTGAGVMDFRIDCSTLRPAGAWLSAVPTHGTIAAGQSQTVAIWVDADTTNGGVFDFYGAVDVHMNTCPDSLAHLPLIATVLRAGDRAATPEAFSLTAQPNPFNPLTTITFELPRTEAVTLMVYDIQGRVVGTLVHSMLSAGSHRMVFDGRALSSGLYFARLQTPSRTLSQKLLLIK